MNEPDGMTHEQRMAHIEDLRFSILSAYHDDGAISLAQKNLDLAHIERLRIIYRPFPAVRRVGTGSACPWGGCIVADTFYGTNGKPQGPRQSDGYEGIYANAAE